MAAPFKLQRSAHAGTCRKRATRAASLLLSWATSSTWELHGLQVLSKWGFPKIRGTFLGVPIIRTIVSWGLYWVPLFGKLPNIIISKSACEASQLASIGPRRCPRELDALPQQVCVSFLDLRTWQYLSDGLPVHALAQSVKTFMLLI